MDPTKENILQSALNLMKATGKEGLTLEAVADLAGITRKTLYNHFSGREEIIEEASMLWIESTLNSLKEISEDASLSMAEKINLVMEQGLNEMRSGSRLTRSPRLEAALLRPAKTKIALEKRLHQFVSEIVCLAQEASYIKKEFETESLTLVILNVVEGLCLTEPMEDSPYSATDILRVSLRAILGGVLTEKGLGDLKTLFT